MKIINNKNFSEDSWVLDCDKHDHIFALAHILENIIEIIPTSVTN